MAAKASRKGNALYLSWDGVDITEQFLTFDPAMEEVTVDSTAGNDALESQFVIRDKTAPTAQIEVDTADTTMMAAMVVGNTGSLIWGFAGSGTGNAKWGITAELVKCNIVANHGDRQIFDCMWINTARDWDFDGRTDTF